MKFAHELKETLDRESFPEHWRAAAIPYSQLKKCLKKVRQELEALGLDKETLQQLLAAHTVSPDGEPVPMASYNLDQAPSQSHSLRPCLSVFVHFQDGQAVDAALSPASRAFLQRLSGVKASPLVSRPPLPHDSSHSASGPVKTSEAGLERIEVPLVFDGEFFNILQSDVDSLDALQQQEEKSMEVDIITLSEEVSAVTKPSKFSKSDLNRWREIFDLYVDAQVFFSSHELDHGSRSSNKAVQQLVWFQKEIQSRGLLNKFKMPSSRLAYTRFLQLNATLLQNLKFQEINKTAITKILKSSSRAPAPAPALTFPQDHHVQVPAWTCEDIRFNKLTVHRVRQADKSRRLRILPCSRPVAAVLGRERRQETVCPVVPGSRLCRATGRRLRLPHLLLHRLVSRSPEVLAPVLCPLCHQVAAGEQETMRHLPR